MAIQRPLEGVRSKGCYKGATASARGALFATHYLGLDRLHAFRVMQGAVPPLARKRQHIGPGVVLCQDLKQLVRRGRPVIELCEAVIPGCHRLLMELTELTVDGLTVVATMTFPSCKKRGRLFGTFCLNAPFFGPRHDHRGVEGLQFRPRLRCLSWHVGTFERIEDRYEEAVKDLIKRKSHGEKIEKPEREEPSNVVSLMDALRASVEGKAGKKTERRKSDRGRHRAAKKVGRSSARHRKAS